MRGIRPLSSLLAVAAVLLVPASGSAPQNPSAPGPDESVR